MVFDDLYIALRDRLLDPEKPDLGIRTIDWENEQAERMEDGDQVEGLILPALLIGYEEPEWKPRGRKHTEAEGTIYLYVLRELSDHPMASDRAAATVAATRATYDQVKAIAARVVGMRGEGYGTVGLTGMQPDHSYRRLRVDVITLRSLLCMDLDTATYETIERPPLAIGDNPPMLVPTVLQQRIDQSTPAQVVAAIQNSPNGPAIEDELCDCEEPGEPGAPVVIRNSENTQLGTVVSGDGPFTAPDGVLRTTDNSTVVQTIPSGKVEQAPQSQMAYLDAAAVEQLTPASNTDYAGGTLRPALVLPRFSALNSQGNVLVHGSVATPTPTVPDVTHTQSNGAAAVLPAGVPLVCTPPVVGVPILYHNGALMSSFQTSSYELGDEGTQRSDGVFDVAAVLGQNTIVPRLLDFYTLRPETPNTFGNQLRFTDLVGAAAAGSGNRWVWDHYHGNLWYVLGTYLTAASWAAAVQAGIAINGTLSTTGLYLPTAKQMMSIVNAQGTAFLSAAPFSVPGSQPIWTSSTTPGNTANAQFISLVSGAAGAGAKSTNSYIHGCYVKRNF